MKGVNPYLNFSGNTEEAFNFYKSVFGGEFVALMRFKDMPEQEDFKVAEEQANNVMHVALPLGGGAILMGSDCPNPDDLKMGNNNYISLNADSREDADRLFKGLSENGKVEMPMADMFWGDYFGSFADKFGVHWMISFNPNE